MTHEDGNFGGRESRGTFPLLGKCLKALGYKQAKVYFSGGEDSGNADKMELVTTDGKVVNIDDTPLKSGIHRGLMDDEGTIKMAEQVMLRAAGQIKREPWEYDGGAPLEANPFLKAVLAAEPAFVPRTWQREPDPRKRSLEDLLYDPVQTEYGGFAGGGEGDYVRGVMTIDAETGEATDEFEWRRESDSEDEDGDDEDGGE